MTVSARARPSSIGADRRRRFGGWPWLSIAAHLGSLAPLAWLIWQFLHDQLTVNPIQALTLRTGKYALVLLALSLACTPLSTFLGWRQVLRVRRALGLYAFLYVSLHFLIFVGLDYGFDGGLLREAIFEKRFAFVGFIAFLLLLPLAITSTRGWMRRLGQAWKRLHRLVYVAALLAVVHYLWAVKAISGEPLAYGAAVAALLMLRLPFVRRLRRGSARGRARDARVGVADQEIGNEPAK